jgi:hypothetical protein
LADDVVAPREADVLEEDRELAAEQVDCPEARRGIRHVLRAATTNLVVEQAGSRSHVGELREWL